MQWARLVFAQWYAASRKPDMLKELECSEHFLGHSSNIQGRSDRGGIRLGLGGDEWE